MAAIDRPTQPVAQSAAARPRPKREREEEVLVWPDLVFIEFIAAVLFTITFLIQAVFINAPLLNRANPDVTPNPSKAPWYFLNLQELLLHMDKAWAGVLLPTIALVFFASIPYVDRSREAQGIWFGTRYAVRLTIIAAVYAILVSAVLVAFDAGDRTHTEYLTRWIPSCDATAAHQGWPCLRDDKGSDHLGIVTTKDISKRLEFSIPFPNIDGIDDDGHLDWPQDVSHIPVPFNNIDCCYGSLHLWKGMHLNLASIMAEQVTPLSTIAFLAVLILYVLFRLGWLRTKRDVFIVMFTAVLASYLFPPWVPVVVIIFVVFGILGLLFVTRSATGAPRIGKDHWHATYQYIVCGKKQPNFPTWEGVGVHTHGDGVIHIHPFTPSEEGQGADLENWFKYGGGTLSGDTVRAPGSSREYHNGDTCDDGTAGTVQVSVNHRKLDDWSRFIPHDGDAVRIVFGPPEDITQLSDRQIIPDADAARTINLEVSGDNEGEGKFSPATLEVNAGEAVKIVIKNSGKLSHGFRAAGDDGKYDTADDFVVKPDATQPGADTGDIIQPGQQGSVVVRFDTATKVEFHDSAAPSATGSFIVRAPAQASPSPSAAAQEPVDVTLDVNVGGSGYDPAQLTVDAGKKFRINLKNGDTFIHNLRIDGPDGLFRTEDDIVTKADVAGGQAGEVVGQIDKPGTYNFRDDFHSTEIKGTITVK